jgi:hypothetical protein
MRVIADSWTPGIGSERRTSSSGSTRDCDDIGRQHRSRGLAVEIEPFDA